MAPAACEGAASHRPRRARQSPLYRLAETHHETLKRVCDERFAAPYGRWRAEVERTLWEFLDCGIEERGFARVRCDACRKEYRVALSCKRRGLCPPDLGRSAGASSRSSLRRLRRLAASRRVPCHAKRAVVWAEWLATEVLAEVEHRQWVFTVPKRLRL